MQELLRQSARASLAAEVLHRTGRVAIRVYGASMLGTLWPGDVVCFAICDHRFVREGDILLCCSDDRLIVHRVRQIRRRGSNLEIVTQGDSQRGCDAPFDGEQVLGRVMYVQRGTSSAREIPLGRSKLRLGFSWMAARSTLFCELAVRIHAACANLASCCSMVPENQNRTAEAKR